MTIKGVQRDFFIWPVKLALFESRLLEKGQGGYGFRVTGQINKAWV